MNPNTFPSLNKISWIVLQVTLPIMAFYSVLIRPPSGFIRSLGFALRVDFWPVIPIAAILVYLAFRIPGQIGQLVTSCVVAFLFAMPLAGMWAYGHTQTSVISGLIQLNDASGFYMDALRLANDTNFSFFSSRRPLFPGFLSVLLLATNNDLMSSLAILSAITAISCYFLTREIQRTHGTETAVFLLMMVFLYYRLHSGISMSENFGIAIGSLGFAILWHGTDTKNLRWIWIGLFSTTIALNARAGAFFILPLLIIWTGQLFREDKLISWKVVFITSTAIFLGFGSNLLVGRIIGRSDGIPFANFSNTLYSLAAGGKSWAYVAEDHPEILLIPEPERTKKMFVLSFELMQAKPGQTVQGMVFFWKSIFTNTLYNVFAFVAKENWVIHPAVKWTLYLLSITGIFAWWQNRKSSLNGLVMICIAGIFLSIPLAPPTDSFRMRPYAASIAMISILPALGFGYLIGSMRKALFRPQPVGEGQPSVFMLPFNTLLLFLILIGPIFIKFTSSKPDIHPKTCTDLSADQIVINFSKGTYINIKKNKDPFLDWAPNYHLYLFQKNSHSIENEHLINWLENIPASQSILVGLDFLTMGGKLIILPSELLPEEYGYIQLCGQLENNPDLKSYHIFYGSEVFPADSEQ
jgi:hypothetical protein